MTNDLSAYCFIGNCRAAALVSRHGSIDWCCFPEFDSPAIFSALLDKKKGGYFSIAPFEKYQSVQHYIANTNVVETTYTTSNGKTTLTDAFVVATEAEKTKSLFPDHEILRVVTCTAGSVQFKLEYNPATYYGKFDTRLEQNKNTGIKFSWKENSCFLFSTLEAEKIKIINKKAIAFFTIRDGQSIIFSLSCSTQSPAILPEIISTGILRMQQTIQFWKNWTSQCNYKGVYEKWVKRSVLTLKLLSYAPSGAIIAAPTTSLPEEIGGERNWDYRYSWLRDASFTIRVLLKLGYEQEAHAYMNWILHATQLTHPKLQVVYSIFGEARLKEKRLDFLDGYRNSKPVRIGNGAYNQHQLDVYGDVLDAYFSYSNIVSEFDNISKKFIIGLGDMICKLWNEPDNGIWEIRSELLHHTHSKVMAWVGLDRLVKLSEKYKWETPKIAIYKKTKLMIKDTIEHAGFNTKLNSYISYFNGESLDATALLFPLVGYCEATSPRMISTVEAICKNLSNNNLIYRYRNIDDGVQGSEGSFGICNFWLVEYYAKSGKLIEAVKLFDYLLEHASPAGLMAEEINPESHEMLGNYPQGFTHIGLINAALSINEAYKRKE